MHAGEAYLLFWEQATARWRPSSLPRNVAHQYYYDWGRQQGTHPIQRPCATRIHKGTGSRWPCTSYRPSPIQAQRRSSKPTSPQPAPGPIVPTPSPPTPMPEQDHPSFMQHAEVASTQLDNQAGHVDGYGGGQPLPALPREVALMLRWLRELAGWGQRQQLPMPLRYELEGAIAVLEDGLAQAQWAQPGTKGKSRKRSPRSSPTPA